MSKSSIIDSKLFPEIKFKPLSSVKNDVAKKVKQEKARKAIAALFKKINDEQFSKYATTYLIEKNRYQRTAGVSPEAMAKFVPPPPPDLDKIAKDHGLERKSTGFITAAQAKDLPILGTASVTDPPTMLFRPFPDALLGPIRKCSAGVVVRSADDMHLALTQDEGARFFSAGRRRCPR